MRVKWLKTALLNVEQIASYIALDNPEAAQKTVAQIRDAVAHLADQPAMGRKGRVPDTRELIIPATPYIIIYRARDQKLEILRVFHTRQHSP